MLNEKVCIKKNLLVIGVIVVFFALFFIVLTSFINNVRLSQSSKAASNQSIIPVSVCKYSFSKFFKVNGGVAEYVRITNQPGTGYHLFDIGCYYNIGDFDRIFGPGRCANVVTPSFLNKGCKTTAGFNEKIWTTNYGNADCYLSAQNFNVGQKGYCYWKYK